MTHDLARLLLDSQPPVRLPGFSGTDAKRIMAGEVIEVINEITGKATPEDLSALLPVALGRYLEPFHLYWYQTHVRPGVQITRLQEQRQNTFFSMAHQLEIPCYVTLDGMIEHPDSNNVIPWEAKCVGGFLSMDKIITREYAQLQMQMLCTGTRHAELSVLFLNQRHESALVELDENYCNEMMHRLGSVWNHITNGAPLPDLEPVEAVTPVEITDHTSNPLWAELETTWLQTKEAHALHNKSIKAIKKLVLPDDQLCFGEKLVARRNKAGAISIRQLTTSDQKLIAQQPPKETPDA